MSDCWICCIWGRGRQCPLSAAESNIIQACLDGGAQKVADVYINNMVIIGEVVMLCIYAFTCYLGRLRFVAAAK